MRTDCVYIDTETVGFAGMPVLLQYAWDDGPVELFDLWLRPIRESLDLIERFMARTVVMFNAAFDQFHLCKWYTSMRQLDLDAYPIDLPVMKVALAERSGRDGPCLKPKGAMDLMLHSRKGEHQSLMSRHDVRIRKVPVQLGEMVRAELETRIVLDPVLKAKWTVNERKNQKGEVSENFVDVVLKFKPDKGLKSLAKHCLGLDPEFHSFQEVWAEREHKYAELKWAPFALACKDPEWRVRNKAGKVKGYCWPKHIQGDVKHWSTNADARRYAEFDVVYTRLLDEYFGFPEKDDDDSILACMVAAVRWHGFAIHTEKTTNLLRQSQKMLEASPININRPVEVRDYIQAVMDPMEGLLLDKSTKKANLERIKDRMVTLELDEGEEPEECLTCEGKGCPRCRGLGVMTPGPMPSSERATEILKVKASAKEVEQHTKVLQAGRFHASFKVIGTLSSRMAGGDGLNAQGIKKSAEVREAFTLAWPGMILCGGDFDSFEVTIADRVYADEQMHKDLLSGLSIHTVMAKGIYPDKTFEQIAASKDKKDGGLIDMYGRGKSSVFAIVYGGDAGTIARKLAIKEKVAEKAVEVFQDRYPGVRRNRELNDARFSSMTQPGGKGTKIYWKDPAEYCETFLGFRRYFTLENRICKALFYLASSMPKSWQVGDFENGVLIPQTCKRRGHEQTLVGAASSAVYGAAFNLQGANTRAASNHLIQSPGAQMTKRLQCVIWDFQPAGVGDWVVAPMNVHDEVMVATDPEVAVDLAAAVKRAVDGFREDVPLIGLKWITDQKDWGEKPKDDDPRVYHMSSSTSLDDSRDPEQDLPEIDEPFEEWVERDDE